MVKASYANDTAKGPGHGFLLIGEAGALAASEGIRLCIKRASDRNCLGLGGWQPAEVFLEPDAFFQEGDTFRMGVGPGVVDNLDAQETYRLTLQGVDGAQGSATLQVAEVVYSPLLGGQGVSSIAAPAAKTPPPPRPAPAPAPEPAPMPEILPEPAPVKKETHSSGGGKLPIILALVLLLLGGGGFAAWKLMGNKEAAPEPPMVQARKHLSGTADAMTGLDMAIRFRAQEGGADAAFLLAEDAAQKGNAAAMALTGDFYSPADAGPAGSIQKDALEAFMWYSKAKAAGSAEAAVRLDALRAWAEAEAVKGSAQAKAVLAKFGE